MAVSEVWERYGKFKLLSDIVQFYHHLAGALLFAVLHCYHSEWY